MKVSSEILGMITKPNDTLMKEHAAMLQEASVTSYTKRDRNPMNKKEHEFLYMLAYQIIINGISMASFTKKYKDLYYEYNMHIDAVTGKLQPNDVKREIRGFEALNRGRSPSFFQRNLSRVTRKLYNEIKSLDPSFEIRVFEAPMVNQRHDRIKKSKDVKTDAKTDVKTDVKPDVKTDAKTDALKARPNINPNDKEVKVDVRAGGIQIETPKTKPMMPPKPNATPKPNSTPNHKHKNATKPLAQASSSALFPSKKKANK